MHSNFYKAPFGLGGRNEIDAAIAERLLAVALSKGGDYADLFFEYRAAGGLVFDEGILKSASRGVSMGLGVRVQKGDATGYAYVEELDWDAMKHAADDRRADRQRARGHARLPIHALTLPEPLRAREGHARRAGRRTSARSSSAPPPRRTPSIRASSRSRRASRRRFARS